MKLLKNIENMTIGSIVNVISSSTLIINIVKFLFFCLSCFISYVAGKSYHNGYRIRNLQDKNELNCVIQIIDKCKNPKSVKNYFFLWIKRISKFRNSYKAT